MFALIAAALLALTGGFFGHLGYLGGPVLADFAAAPGAPHRAQAIVLLSGDMGIRLGMGHDVARRLAADGFAVTGVNSLTYYRVARTPAQAEALLARAIAHAEAAAHTDRVILIGQSFGADQLHVALADAPEPLRRQIRFIGLVVPGETVTFRASPSELFGGGPAIDAWPTAQRLDWAPVSCIQGADETDSLCPTLAKALPNVTRTALPGGHPMRRDDAAVHRALLAGIEAALARPAP